MPGSRTQSVAGRVVPWLLLGVLGIASVGPLVTPMAPDGSSPDAISVVRAVDHIDRIASHPHPMGTAANAEVRAYIVTQLIAMGLDPELQTATVPDYFGTPGTTVEVVNVMARIRGTVGSKAVVLMGHYDSVPTTPGANDDAAAVAVILEVGRVLVNGPSLANDVILLFTDGEEPAPRFGSAAFVAQHRWADDVGFVINLEAAGGSGPSMVIEIAGPSGWSVGGLAEGSPDPVAFSFPTETASAIGGIGTDFDSFVAAGIPGVHFAYLRGSPIYHTPNDSPTSVNAGSVGHHGSNALGIVQFFGNADLAEPPRTGDDIFFSVLHSHVVRYPTGWSFPLAMAALVVFGVAAALASRRGTLRAMGMVGAATAVLGGIVVSMLVVSGIWWLVTGIRTSPGMGESYVYLAAVALVIVAIWMIVRRLARKRWSIDDVLAGTAIIWLMLALATSATLDGVSYLFLWPALGASALLLVRAPVPGVTSRLGIPGVLLVGTPTLLLLTPPIDTFFQMALPRPGNPDSEMIGVIGVVALLTFLCVALVGSSMAPGTEGGHLPRPHRLAMPSGEEPGYTVDAMNTEDKTVLPPGHQPYDPLNGLRVGAFAGIALGAVGAALTRIGWLLLIGAVVGAVAGYVTERNRLRRETSRLHPPDDTD